MTAMVIPSSMIRNSFIIKEKLKSRTARKWVPITAFTDAVTLQPIYSLARIRKNTNTPNAAPSFLTCVNIIQHRRTAMKNVIIRAAESFSVSHFVVRIVSNITIPADAANSRLSADAANIAAPLPAAILTACTIVSAAGILSLFCILFIFDFKFSISVIPSFHIMSSFLSDYPDVSQTPFRTPTSGIEKRCRLRDFLRSAASFYFIFIPIIVKKSSSGFHNPG